MPQRVYIQVEERVLRRLDDLAKRMGYTRSEAIRQAVRRFLSVETAAPETRRMKGIVRSKLTLQEFKEAYEAAR